MQQPESRLTGFRAHLDKTIGDKHEEVMCRMGAIMAAGVCVCVCVCAGAAGVVQVDGWVGLCMAKRIEGIGVGKCIHTPSNSITHPHTLTFHHTSTHTRTQPLPQHTLHTPTPTHTLYTPPPPHPAPTNTQASSMLVVATPSSHSVPAPATSAAPLSSALLCLLNTGTGIPSPTSSPWQYNPAPLLGSTQTCRYQSISCAVTVSRVCLRILRRHSKWQVRRLQKCLLLCCRRLRVPRKRCVFWGGGVFGGVFLGGWRGAF